MTNLVIGQQTADGIYIGQYKSLGKIFEAYAAPENPGKQGYQGLGALATYDNTRALIAKLKNFHGFDGTNYATATEMHKALEDGSYNGGWIIPTCEMLRQNVTLIKAALQKVDLHHDIYWSSTEHPEFKNNVYAHRMWDGYAVYEAKYANLHCRPVRLVPVTP